LIFSALWVHIKATFLEGGFFTRECKQITKFVEKETNVNSRVSLRRDSLKSA